MKTISAFYDREVWIQSSSIAYGQNVLSCNPLNFRLFTIVITSFILSLFQYLSFLCRYFWKKGGRRFGCKSRPWSRQIRVAMETDGCICQRTSIKQTGRPSWSRCQIYCCKYFYILVLLQVFYYLWLRRWRSVIANLG